MIISDIERFCRNYFHLELPDSLQEATLLALKCLSYLTFIAPIALGIGLGISTLINRVVHKKEPSEVEKKIQTAAEPAVNNKRRPLFKPKNATEFNLVMRPLLKLPHEIIGVIGSHLENPEAFNLSCTAVNKALSSYFAPKKNLVNEIQELIQFATFFDDQIRSLTEGARSLIKNDQIKNEKMDRYTLFQFDLKKWVQISENFHKIKLLCNADQLLAECRWDLIEALSEYNINSIFFNGDNESIILKRNLLQKDVENFISKLHAPEDQSKLQEILNQAKKTLKGEIHDFFRLKCFVNNPENGDWENYERFPFKLTSDLLIGKRENDRLIIDNYILRCSLPNFETQLTRALFIPPAGDLSPSPDYHARIERLKKAYGGDSFFQNFLNPNR